MPRQPHHSNNYGGARPGAGRPRGGFNRLTKETIEKALAAPIHPVDFLLEMVANEELPMKQRGAAAQSLLPYVATRLAVAEITVNHDLSEQSEENLIVRLLSAQDQLARLGVKAIEGQVVRVNGHAEKAPINGKGADRA